MIIFAPEARNEGKIEDYRRLMYSQIKKHNVPTWVIGYGREVIVNNKLEGESLVAKVWPIREPAKIITSAELNPIIDQLMDNHCRIGTPKNGKD